MGVPAVGSRRWPGSAERGAGARRRAPTLEELARSGRAPARGVVLGALLGLGLWIVLGAGLLLAL